MGVERPGAMGRDHSVLRSGRRGVFLKNKHVKTQSETGLVVLSFKALLFVVAQAEAAPSFQDLSLHTL